MLKVIFSFVLMLAICSCSFMRGNNYEQQVKSPCVGGEGSPCAHIPVNTWLDSAVYQQVYNKTLG